MSGRKKLLGLSLSDVVKSLRENGLKVTLDFPKGKIRDKLRLHVACRSPLAPESYQLSVLRNGPAIDTVDYHPTSYVDDKGVRTKGWHRDERINGKTVRNLTLQVSRRPTDMLNGTGEISSGDFGDLETPDGDTAFVLSTNG